MSKVDASSEAVRTRIKVLEIDYAAARETIAAKDAEIARLTRERDDAVKAEREACANVYDNFFDWVGKQISEAAYQAEEHKKGEAAWATLANSMFDGTLASYRDAIRERANTKEPTT